MEHRRLRVLLIEDNPGDARLIQAILGEARAVFDLEWADHLAAGLELLGAGPMDLVLLDLGLPDSQGLETVARVRESAPRVPVVVLTGTDDNVLAMEALELGAQDYLIKGQVDTRLILRSIRHAFEGHQAAAWLDRELSALQRIGDSFRSAADLPLSVSAPLSETQPGTFVDLVDQYEEAMDLALEPPSDEGTRRVSTMLRQLAQRLGCVGAGPDDVVRVHTATLERQADAKPPRKGLTHGQEGRLLVLELMGHLAAFYRGKAAQMTERPDPANPE